MSDQAVLVNPLTRQILVLNHPGHPDQGVHDPTGGRGLKKIKSVRELVRPEDPSVGKSGFVLPNGDLVDLEGTEHFDAMADHPEEFGLPKKGVLDRDAFDTVTAGAIRFRGGSSVQLDPDHYSPRQIADLILEEKLPASIDGEVVLDAGRGFSGGTDVDELLEAKSWKHLQNLKKRRSGE